MATVPGAVTSDKPEAMQVPREGVAVLTRPHTHSANPVHGLEASSINRVSLAHLLECNLLCSSWSDSSPPLAKEQAKKILSLRHTRFKSDL